MRSCLGSCQSRYSINTHSLTEDPLPCLTPSPPFPSVPHLTSQLLQSLQDLDSPVSSIWPRPRTQRNRLGSHLLPPTTWTESKIAQRETDAQAEGGHLVPTHPPQSCSAVCLQEQRRAEPPPVLLQTVRSTPDYVSDLGGGFCFC